ncbi:porin family protein [Pseudomonas edaphica]|uniref:Porin family protein n=1 Tax=Pseudomonas edaphica TaxID=2006980 RepID=A0ABY2U271_9PSED|nr:outer membrane beta-barrel protein [Pseudomonas edaphica]TLG90310.1 porin family protein [Pseudomonas edaphica]
MKKITGVLFSTAFCFGTAYAEGWYGSAKLNNARQNLSSPLLTSPRVVERVANPDSTKTFTGSFSVGYAFTEGWRLEGEYTTKSDANFDTRWAPFNPNVNRMQVTSQRLMINGYKDIPIIDWLSFYGMAGVGLARVDSEGYQSNAARRFAKHTQNNVAYSLGIGLNAKVGEKTTVGLGYRYIAMGDIETGHNTFANRINARDEQLKGKLKEQNLFLEARVLF